MPPHAAMRVYVFGQLSFCPIGQILLVKPVRDQSEDASPIGRRLRARSLAGQKAEAGIGCAPINQMTRVGMLILSRVA